MVRLAVGAVSLTGAMLAAVSLGPVYAAIGVDLAGHKDILGLWVGDGDGESAKFWYAVLTDPKNRGVCDGLKGLPAFSPVTR